MGVMAVEEAVCQAWEQHEGWWERGLGCDRSGVRGRTHPFLGLGRLLRAWF